MDAVLNRLLKQLELFNGPDNAPERMYLIDQLRDHVVKNRFPVEAGWQSIESAPKDGTSLMLYFPGYEQPIQIGYFAVIETTKNGKQVQKDEYWCGKWMDHWIIRSCFSNQDLPSHWMPLPNVAAPETAEEVLDGEFEDDGTDWGDDQGFDSNEILLSPGVECFRKADTALRASTITADTEE